MPVTQIKSCATPGCSVLSANNGSVVLPLLLTESEIFPFPFKCPQPLVKVSGSSALRSEASRHSGVACFRLAIEVVERKVFGWLKIG